MRSLLRTAVVLGLTGMLLGCPPPEKKDTAPADGGGATSQPADAPADPPADAPPADAPADPPAATTKKVDLSHLKVGQKYHYKMNNAGTEMVQIYEVKAITDTEVKYTVANIMGGNPLGDPAEQSWPIPATVEVPVEAPADAPKVEMTKETVEIAGMKWDCWVTEAGGYKTWSPQKNDLPTFPMFVKQMQGDKVTNILEKIE